MTQTIEINRDLAVRVLEVVDAGLSNGMGVQKPGEMCVEAAVCYAMGLPHSDDPGCVARSLRSLKIRLNDSSWSSKAARAKGLRRLAIAQLGSKGVLDELEFVRRVVDNAIRKQAPIALRAAASIQKNETRRAALQAAADRCEKEGTREAALEARRAAYAAYAADAADAAYAAYAASAADAADAAYAAYAADAASAAYADDAASAAYAAARDKSLSNFAEDVVQILVDMKAPGTEWLDLAPVEQAA